LNVTLSLSASNGPTSMHFTNNDGGSFSAYESYNTVKSWTMAGGGDGPRSVGVQYQNAGGTSTYSSGAGTPACKDSTSSPGGGIIYDTTAPSSSVTPLPSYSRSPVPLTWGGTDNLAPSNELRYHLQYNINEGSWIDLISSSSSPISQTSYSFPGNDGTRYCFQVRARDPAGNYETFPGGSTGDTCTTIDTGIEMYGFGYDLREKNPDVWVSVFDGKSGINFSSLACAYSENTGSSWTSYPCNFDETDPTTVLVQSVPYTTVSDTQNMARFTACDNAGNCVTNPFTVDNRTGPWTRTTGGDVHANQSLDLGSGATAQVDYIVSARGNIDTKTNSVNSWVLPYYPEGDISGLNTPIATPTYEELMARFGAGAASFSGSLPNATGVWRNTGSQTVSSEFTFASGQQVLIFIDGDLVIDAQIHVPSDSAVVFAVGGRIRFAKSLVGGAGGIDQADGLYVAEGEISTGYDFVSEEVTRQLVIAGALISLRDTVVWGRNLSDDDNVTTPAEQINFEPKYYILMATLFGEPQVNWREIAP